MSHDASAPMYATHVPATTQSRSKATAIVLLLAIAVVGGIIGWWLIGSSETPSSSYNWAPPSGLEPKRAFGYLEKICEFGPRPSGTPAIEKLQAYLIEHFKALGATVETQDFEVRHPLDGTPVTMRNLIVRIRPELKRRVLLCTHYDTRPFPDYDPVNPQGVFIGANDGASGPALFQEIAPQLLKMDLNVGVDLVMFDGEELIFENDGTRGEYFLGSKHFATRYATDPKDFVYEAGILVDMIADKELQLYYERHSYDFARNLVRDVWAIAAKLKIREFVQRTRHTVRDDHLPLNEIARIPTIDIIDFDYPRPSTRGQKYWHTEQDIPANCSGESICKVGAVLLEWVKGLK
jgi:glutaminyl-peptide cyclotransferase